MAVYLLLAVITATVVAVIPGAAANAVTVTISDEIPVEDCSQTLIQLQVKINPQGVFLKILLKER
jgi:hypothetical protein